MPSDESKLPMRRLHTGAVGVAVVLLVASGFGYRTLVEIYAKPSSGVPIPQGTLAQLSMDIQDWKGREVPMDERILERTDTDDHVNRRYVRASTQESVALWVAYGVRLRDLMPHRPEVCYPGAGWTLTDKTDLQLDLEGGETLTCRTFQFTRGLMANEQIVVLSYFLVDGAYCPDVSLLRSQAWRLSRTARYVAQVQITCSADRSMEQAEESARAFAVASAFEIRQLLTDAVEAVEPASDLPVN